MATRAIVPAELRGYYDDWRMSPGLEHNGVIYATGMTARMPDGTIPVDPEAQIREVFRKIGLVLDEAGLGYEDILEMTSYHVGLREHLETFRSIRAEYVSEPYPAWTAIEVAGFASEGVVVEIRIIAKKR
jgi:enamine deaminase RidA (YjgF/YER057c/UK114 family)